MSITPSTCGQHTHGAPRQPGDATSALKALERFSQSSPRAWLKFGAADEKGTSAVERIESEASETGSAVALVLAVLVSFFPFFFLGGEGGGSPFKIQLPPKTGCRFPHCFQLPL